MKKIFSFLILGVIILDFSACQKIDFSNNQETYSQSGTENGYGYVDLGLSVKWATCNVGATKPEEYGYHFAWGETQPKSTYDWLSEGDYKWGVYNYSATPNYGMTKYNNTDGETTLYPDDDAAQANWGGIWRMPTFDEQKELLHNCTWTWKSRNGVKGCEVKGKNGNSIFLPAAGLRNGSNTLYEGSRGNYCSMSVHSENPFNSYYLSLSSESQHWNYGNRFRGLSVRAVCSK